METTAHVTMPRVKIALIKVAKGYRWIIEVTHEDHEEAMEILEETEKRLKDLYGSSA